MTDAAISRLHALVVPPATSRWGRFVEGASAPWLGLKVLLLRPRLWKHAIVPLLVNLAIMAAAFLAMIGMGIAFLAGLYYLLGDEWDEGYWLFAKIALLILTAFAMVMVCIAAAVVTWRLLSAIFCARFYARIARQVEIDLGMQPHELRTITVGREVADAMTDLGWLIVSLALALTMSLVPFVGAPVALAYSLYFQVLTCGRNQLSFPLALRGLPRRQRLEFCHRHLSHTLGLGTVVLVMEFVPILGALLMVTAAAGSVILHRRLMETA